MAPIFYKSFLSNFLVAFLGVCLIGAGEPVLRICGVGMSRFPKSIFEFAPKWPMNSL
ncbi:MAG: hypothetical protein HZA02_04525 [Nitrospinae bacterium]|nr:hypothetical protein [Nitrospinota bacterium]